MSDERLYMILRGRMNYLEYVILNVISVENDDDDEFLQDSSDEDEEEESEEFDMSGL